MEGRRGEVATGLIGVSIARSFVVFQRDSELCTPRYIVLLLRYGPRQLIHKESTRFDRLVRL